MPHPVRSNQSPPRFRRFRWRVGLTIRKSSLSRDNYDTESTDRLPEPSGRDRATNTKHSDASNLSRWHPRLRLLMNGLGCRRIWEPLTNGASGIFHSKTIDEPPNGAILKTLRSSIRTIRGFPFGLCRPSRLGCSFGQCIGPESD